MDPLDIVEPQNAISIESNLEICIGIDLGTTNSLVSFYDGIEAKIIGPIIPSTMDILDDQIIIGSLSDDAIRSVKRLMGKNIHDQNFHQQFLNPTLNEDNVVKIEIAGKKFSPEEVSANILNKLKEQAEEYFKQEIRKVVITVPAYFDERAKNATKNAANIAGMQVLRLINEPTSAAVAYGLDCKNAGTYIIYDLGGGTFDISIIKMQNGIFKVIATSGDRDLGGDDLDLGIAKFIAEKYKIILSKELINVAKLLKENSINNDNQEIIFASQKISITKNEINNIVFSYIKKTIDLLDEAVENADIDIIEIEGIVLVGGSTKLPLIKELLNSHFDNKVPIFDEINPDEIVAKGAAITAYNLTHKTNNLLIDVLPLSLGIEIYGGMFERIITRNTPIPCSVSKEFTTYEHGMNKMLIHVMQGERELAEKNRSLAKFIINNLAGSANIAAVVKVTFNIDSDGLLTVGAENKDTGERYNIEIKPSYGLTSDYVEKIIEESYINAKDDFMSKKLIKARMDANLLIKTLKEMIIMDSRLVEEIEIDAIESSILNLEEIIEGDDYKKIEDKINELNIVAMNFIEIRTNHYLKLALNGRDLG